MKSRIACIEICFCLVIVAMAAAVLAQSPPPSLTDGKLIIHGTLPQQNPPGHPLAQLMSQSRSAAPSRGVVWKGLNIVASDEEAGSATIPVSTLLLQQYSKQACHADAIFIGHPTSFAYHLSSSGTGIYGDYLFAIENVVKDNPTASLRSAAEVVVTRPGGSLTLADGPITFDLKAFPRLQPNATYLMFMRHIPQSSAYQSLDASSTLIATGNLWTLARQAFSGLSMPELTRGVFETTITSGWLPTCK